MSKCDQCADNCQHDKKCETLEHKLSQRETIMDKKELLALRNELYEALPTGADIPAFELLLTINDHIKKLDAFLDKDEPVFESVLKAFDNSAEIPPQTVLKKVPFSRLAFGVKFKRIDKTKGFQETFVKLGFEKATQWEGNSEIEEALVVKTMYHIEGTEEVVIVEPEQIESNILQALAELREVVNAGITDSERLEMIGYPEAVAICAKKAIEYLQLERDHHQVTIIDWAINNFGKETLEIKERISRFIEESVELAQSEDFPIQNIYRIAEYVYSKPKGEIYQEVGGVGVTLLAYCQAKHLSAEACEKAEIARILSKTKEHFVERQNIKAASRIATPVNL